MNTNFHMILMSSLVIFATFIIMLGFPNYSRQNMEEPSMAYESPGCSTTDFSGKLTTDSLAFFDGRSINIPSLAMADEATQVLGLASEERWIEVDLSDQMLYAWEGSELFVSTAVSTGLPWTPTPEGEFRIWIKLRATKMEGGEGAYYYYLPNVPYVMFFENPDVPGYLGYGLHGTYWHSDFGTQRSHGCVNLPTNIAELLYYWTSPDLSGKNVVRASNQELGTRIVIHE